MEGSAEPRGAELEELEQKPEVPGWAQKEELPGSQSSWSWRGPWRAVPWAPCHHRWARRQAMSSPV